MAPQNRPRFSLTSLAAHILSPKKNPKPTGLRKRKLSGKRGQKRDRVRRYNSWPAEKQAVLDKTGMRDDYLKGEVSYKDAVNKLSVDAAYERGMGGGDTVEDIIFSRLNNAIIATHVRAGFKTKPEGGQFDPKETRIRLTYLPDSVKPQVINASASEIRRKASDKSYEVMTPYRNRKGETVAFNPFWYH